MKPTSLLDSENKTIFPLTVYRNSRRYYKKIVQILITIRKWLASWVNQYNHHNKQSFKDEYIALLKAFEIDYDDNYLFDWID